MSDNLKVIEKFCDMAESLGFDVKRGHSQEFAYENTQQAFTLFASQQAAHEAEIARLKEELADLRESWNQEKLLVESRNQMLFDANADCAMKDEALKELLGIIYDMVEKWRMVDFTQQVSEWERKQLAEAEQRGAVKALEGQWITDSTRPEYGEYVLVMTTDCDDDPIAVAAHFNGKSLYLGVGGKKISPALGWMRIPKFQATSKKAG